MRKESNISFKIGVIFFLGISVLGLAILGITSKQRIFERKVEFYSCFEDTSGLKEGSVVMFQGVEVGIVTDIEFSEDPEVNLIKVRYKIPAKLLPRINSDVYATIKSLGLLGDKYISLEMSEKKSSHPVNLLPNTEIKSYTPVSLRELGQGAQDIMTSLNDLSKNINQLVLLISTKGPIARIMKDEKLGEELLIHYKNIIASLDNVTSKLRNGTGILGGMMAKEGEGDKSAQSLRNSIKNMEEILSNLNEGKSALGVFLSGREEGELAKKRVLEFLETLELYSNALKNRDSFAYKLFIEERYGEELASNLLSISRSLDSILKKIDKGEGSVGALINDKEVYETLSLTSKGIQKSKIVKWYLEKKAKKAAKEEKEREENIK